MKRIRMGGEPRVNIAFSGCLRRMCSTTVDVLTHGYGRRVRRDRDDVRDRK
jgi:hypothetical protein